MAIVSETAVSLRITGDDLNPDEVTGLLGATPSSAAQKSGVWHTPRGKSMPARTGFWLLSAENEKPGNFDLQIKRILDRLTGDLAIWADLSKRFQTELFCGAFMHNANEGTGLSAGTILAMAERGLRFELDLYAILEDDDD